jgi:hypothetical protein
MADKSQKKSVQFSAGLDDSFNTTKAGLTPSINRLAPQYRNPEERSTQAQAVAPPSSISRPNYEGNFVLLLYVFILKLVLC